MHRFVRNLITEWRQLELPFADETVIVAVSGGADSVSLLLAIDDLRKRKKLDLRIVIAHFDHRLLAESVADLEYVKKLAATRKFELVHGEWRRNRDGNVEQSARNARYTFLGETAAKLKAGYVLTAHTMNDQAETVMMNFIRGSGTDGLGGMHRMRELETDIQRDDEPFLPFSSPGIQLVRPLLSWATRRDTEGFCHESEVEYRTDVMNEDLNFRRVWVRKVLLPMVEEMNPKIVETLCRTADLMQNLPEPPGIHPDGDHLKIADLKGLEKQEILSTIRSWLKERRGNLRGLSLKHFEAIWHLITSTKSGRVVQIPKGEVSKHDGTLKWREIKVDK